MHVENIILYSILAILIMPILHISFIVYFHDFIVSIGAA